MKNKDLAIAARLLEYPQEELKFEEAHQSLIPAIEEILKLSLKEQQEHYTKTFDLQMICYPYVGYHLFGESFKRGAFLAILTDKYKEYGFKYQLANENTLKELPDHLALILSFISQLNINNPKHSQERTIIIKDALVPALNSMLANFGFEDETIMPIGFDLLHSSPHTNPELEEIDISGIAASCASEEDSSKSKEIESWERKRDEDNKQGLNRNNPYVKLLKTLLDFMEEEIKHKGELSHA